MLDYPTGLCRVLTEMPVSRNSDGLSQCVDNSRIVTVVDTLYEYMVLYTITLNSFLGLELSFPSRSPTALRNMSVLNRCYMRENILYLSVA